MIHKFSSLETW